MISHSDVYMLSIIMMLILKVKFHYQDLIYQRHLVNKMKEEEIILHTSL